MPRLIRWAEHEVYTAIPAFLFFLLTFNLLHYSFVLMLGPYARYTSYLGATIGAIFAAKIIIIVRNLPFINAFPHKPLIYNITWKLWIYSFFVLLVQILDFFVRRFFLHHQTAALVFQELSVELLNPVFWGTQLLIIFDFTIYLTFSELGRVLGPKDLRKMTLGF
jgi:hypothetical protein